MMKTRSISNRRVSASLSIFRSDDVNLVKYAARVTQGSETPRAGKSMGNRVTRVIRRQLRTGSGAGVGRTPRPADFRRQSLPISLMDAIVRSAVAIASWCRRLRSTILSVPVSPQVTDSIEAPLPQSPCWGAVIPPQTASNSPSSS